MNHPFTKFKLIQYPILAVLMMLVWASTATAGSLQQAKIQGLVGERQDGYVGYVVKPAADETKVLVKSVNAKRRAKFQKTAKNNTVSVDDVAKLFFQRALKATKTGHFVQNRDGSWRKK